MNNSILLLPTFRNHVLLKIPTHARTGGLSAIEKKYAQGNLVPSLEHLIQTLFSRTNTQPQKCRAKILLRHKNGLSLVLAYTIELEDQVEIENTIWRKPHQISIRCMPEHYTHWLPIVLREKNISLVIDQTQQSIVRKLTMS